MSIMLSVLAYVHKFEGNWIRLESLITKPVIVANIGCVDVSGKIMLFCVPEHFIDNTLLVYRHVHEFGHPFVNV